jgi:hypothetical protein
MTDIAIRVDNFTLSSVEGLSKLYPEPAARAGHLGALQQRHDTTSTVLSASLRDALTGMFRRGHQSTNPQSTNTQSTNPHSGDLWALRVVSFEASPAPQRRYAKCNRRVPRGLVDESLPP